MKFRVWLRDEVYKIPQKERGIAPVFGSTRHPSQIPYSESVNSSRINLESNLDVRFRFGRTASVGATDLESEAGTIPRLRSGRVIPAAAWNFRYRAPTLG